MDKAKAYSNVQLHRPGEQRNQQPTRPADDVTRVMKGLQGPTQLTEWDDGEARK